MSDSDLTKLTGEIAGPPDTPYEGGRYLLEIIIPETYPFNPPKVSKIQFILHESFPCLYSNNHRGRSNFKQNYKIYS